MRSGNTHAYQTRWKTCNEHLKVSFLASSSIFFLFFFFSTSLLFSFQNRNINNDITLDHLQWLIFWKKNFALTTIATIQTNTKATKDSTQTSDLNYLKILTLDSLKFLGKKFAFILFSTSFSLFYCALVCRSFILLMVLVKNCFIYVFQCFFFTFTVIYFHA